MSCPVFLLGPSPPDSAHPLCWPTSGLYLDDIISLELPGTWTVSVFLGLNLRFDLLERMCLTPSFLQDYLFYLLGRHSCSLSLSQAQLGWVSGALQSLPSFSSSPLPSVSYCCEPCLSFPSEASFLCAQFSIFLHFLRNGTSCPSSGSPTGQASRTWDI